MAERMVCGVCGQDWPCRCGREPEWYERMKIRDMSGARPEHVLFTPSGRGNIFWCWIINDAFFLKWREDKNGIYVPTCGGCGWKDSGYYERGESLSIAFMVEHTFICGICKPTKSWRYCDMDSFNKFVDTVEGENDGKDSNNI